MSKEIGIQQQMAEHPKLPKIGLRSAGEQGMVQVRITEAHKTGDADPMNNGILVLSENVQHMPGGQPAIVENTLMQTTPDGTTRGFTMQDGEYVKTIGMAEDARPEEVQQVAEQMLGAFSTSNRYTKLEETPYLKHTFEQQQVVFKGVNATEDGSNPSYGVFGDLGKHDIEPLNPPVDVPVVDEPEDKVSLYDNTGTKRYGIFGND